MEQARDSILLQLKAKIRNEEYSEEIHQQDRLYKHYLNTSDRIVLKDEVITRQYYDETGQDKYHQILLPKHLLEHYLIYMARHTYTLAYQKCCRKFARNITTQGLQNMSKNG